MIVKVYKDKTASIDIDAQNGFTFNCPGELPVDGGTDIVNECNLNATKSKVRYASKDAHPSNGVWTADENNKQFSIVGLPNVDIRWNQHCVVGTYGFELISGLPKMSEYDFIVYKGVERDLHPYSPCYHDLNKTISTGIIEKLSFDGINTVILGGLALNYCLGEGAMDLKNAGFDVIVNLSSTAGIGTEQEIQNYIKKLKELDIIFVDNANEIDSI